MKAWAPDGYTVIEWPTGRGLVPTNDDKGGAITHRAKRKVQSSLERYRRERRKKDRQEGLSQ